MSATMNKILMIDDDRELLNMLRCYFEMKSYDVVTAENGAEALERLQTHPDIILLLYAGSIQELLDHARGCVWDCVAGDAAKARELEQRYRISSKQYVENGIALRILSRTKPDIDCRPQNAALEDAYLYLTGEPLPR